MESCYTLLGISPAATSEEIEAAYQDKKRAPGIGEEALKELDRAYDEAIIATFAPIKPFAVPSPSVSQAYASQAGALKAQPAARHQTENAIPPVSISIPDFSFDGAPARSFYVKSPRELDGLVEEGPTPTDEQLLNMDIGQLRDTYGYGVKEPLIFTWGIRDRLLRYYAKSYVAFVVLDLFMILTLGSALQNYTHMQAVAAASVPPSTLESVLKAFISTAYYFLFALPLPIVMRFFVMGEPPETVTARWMLSSLAVCAALALHYLLGGLFGKWAGFVTSLAFVTIMLSNATLKYTGAADS